MHGGWRSFFNWGYSFVEFLCPLEAARYRWVSVDRAVLRLVVRCDARVCLCRLVVWKVIQSFYARFGGLSEYLVAFCELLRKNFCFFIHANMYLITSVASVHYVGHRCQVMTRVHLWDGGVDTWGEITQVRPTRIYGNFTGLGNRLRLFRTHWPAHLYTRCLTLLEVNMLLLIFIIGIHSLGNFI